MVRRSTSYARARWTAVFRHLSTYNIRRVSRRNTYRQNTEMKEYFDGHNVDTSLRVIVRNGVPRAYNVGFSQWEAFRPV